eukprot:tig00021133_g18905.t1
MALEIADKWDAALERQIKSTAFGVLVGGFFGFVLARTGSGRAAFAAFGAGTGFGHAYRDTQLDFEKLNRAAQKS